MKKLTERKLKRIMARANRKAKAARFDGCIEVWYNERTGKVEYNEVPRNMDEGDWEHIYEVECHSRMEGSTP